MELRRRNDLILKFGSVPAFRVALCMLKWLSMHDRYCSDTTLRLQVVNGTDGLFSYGWLVYFAFLIYNVLISLSLHYGKS